MGLIQECPQSPGPIRQQFQRMASRSPRSPRTPRTPGGRRASLQNGMSMLLMRTSSVKRLFPSKNRDGNSLWGNESTSDLSLGTSFSSLSDNEHCAVGDLLKEVTETIEKLTKCKQQIEQQIESNITLARARYTDGGTRMGAILPMRKAHQNKTVQTYTAAACFQLDEMRQTILKAMEPNSQFEVDVVQQRSRLKDIMGGLKKAKTPMPSDEDLLKQLQKSIDLDKTSGP